MAANAQPLLSFERGNTVLFNPDNNDIVLRSANVGRVRLELYAAPSVTAENQVQTARLARSITENGLLARMVDGQKPVWQSDFILSNEQESITQPVPVIVAAGALHWGDYVLKATAGDVSVVQWFSMAPFVIVNDKKEVGDVTSVVVDTTGKNAMANAVIVALNNKGEIIGGARTDDNGVAKWQVPAETVALRAERDMPNEQRAHAFLSLVTTAAVTETPADTKGALKITPDFEGGVATSGATANFTISRKGGSVPLPLTYQLVQESTRYEWVHDADNNWKYKTITVPSVVQGGSIKAAPKGVATLALPVGEGRYRLNITSGNARGTFLFTAGWWRNVDTPSFNCTLADNKPVCVAP